MCGGLGNLSSGHASMIRDNKLMRFNFDNVPHQVSAKRYAYRSETCLNPVTDSPKTRSSPLTRSRWLNKRLGKVPVRATLRV